MLTKSRKSSTHARKMFYENMKYCFVLIENGVTTPSTAISTTAALPFIMQYTKNHGGTNLLCAAASAVKNVFKNAF